MVFRTDELVNVAAKHDQIGVISHALLDYISALYQQYANSYSQPLTKKDYEMFLVQNTFEKKEGAQQ